MFKRVTISIDEKLNERWTNTARRLELSKSGMVEEYLNQILPILEQESPNRMLVKAMKQMSIGINASADLFLAPTYNERAEFDKSVEDYKKEKLG